MVLASDLFALPYLRMKRSHPTPSPQKKKRNVPSSPFCSVRQTDRDVRQSMSFPDVRSPNPNEAPRGSGCKVGQGGFTGLRLLAGTERNQTSKTNAFCFRFRSVCVGTNFDAPRQADANLSPSSARESTAEAPYRCCKGRQTGWLAGPNLRATAQRA
jgi:hypothetical protein